MVIVAQPSSYQLFGISPFAQMILGFANSNPGINFILLLEETLKMPGEIPANLKIEKLKAVGKNKLTTYYWRKIKLPAYLLKSKASYFITDAFPALNFGTTKSIFLSPQTFDLPLIKATSQQEPEDFSGFCFYLNQDTAANVVPVLKAFSIFKKRLRSGLNLNIISEAGTSIVISGIETYKYREELDYSKCDGFEGLQGYAQNSLGFFYLPALIPDKFLLRMVLQNAAVMLTNKSEQFNPTLQSVILPVSVSPADLAEKMMALYKNEAQVLAYKKASLEYIANEPQVLLDDILNGDYDYIKSV